MFIYLKEENKHVYIPYDTDTISPKLESGIYDLDMTGSGLMVFQKNKAFEKGKAAKAGIFKKVQQYVDSYFSDNGKLVRKEMGQQTRLGLFFKGDPGTGKTFLAAKLASKLIQEENGICIYTTKLSMNMTEIIDAIRSKDPDKLVVFILDEFEKDYERLTQSRRDELLSFLDGGKSRDNVVVIATANSLSGIPSTLLKRPGRFEQVLEFEIKDKSVLTNLIEALVPESFQSKIDIKSLYKKVEGIANLTIDRLKSVIRDALTNYLNVGQLFPNEYEMIPISEHTIDKESKKKKKQNKDPFRWLINKAKGVTDVDYDD